MNRRIRLVAAVVSAALASSVMTLVAPAGTVAALVPEQPAERSSFRPLTPARLSDTRPGKSTVDGIAAGTGSYTGARPLTVTGRGGVPSSGVAAVAINVTAAAPSSGGYMTVHPDGQARPTASNLNYSRGGSVSNMVVAKVGVGGRISIFNSGATHVVVDVLGWFPSASDYAPLTPARVRDSRPGAITVDGQEAGIRPYRGGDWVKMLGRGGVPTSGVEAVVVNVTVISPTTDGYTTVHPGPGPAPNASNINYAKGQTVAGLVISKVGEGTGVIDVYNSTTAHIVVDVLGWIPIGSDLTSFVPARLTDTRPGKSTVDGLASGAGAYTGTRDLLVAGRAGVPRSGIGAVVLNLTITSPTGGGFTTVHPSGVARPNASNLNFSRGQTVANLVVAKIGQNGRISIYNSAGAHVIVDVLGWYPGDGGLAPATKVSAVSAGWDHTCALTTGGAARCWGTNAQGQVGDGTTTLRRSPVPVTGLSSGVVAISSGNLHTCALTSGGAVRCWGDNTLGQLGDGTTTARTTPVTVSGLSSGVTSIATGRDHTCAVMSGGSVKCWGQNPAGQLGDGQQVTRQLTPVSVVGLASARSVATGTHHSCAVTTSGGLRCWGANTLYQLGDGTAVSRLAPVTPVGMGSGVESVTSRDSHTCAVTTSGVAKCWGANNWGQIGTGDSGAGSRAEIPTVPVGLGSGVSSMSVGLVHSCALTTSREVACWGPTNRLPTPPGVTPVHTPYFLRSLGPVTQVTAGNGPTCVLTSVGAVKCWGLGVMGDGSDGPSRAPVDVLGLS